MAKNKKLTDCNIQNKKGFVDRRLFARLHIRLPLKILENGQDTAIKAQTIDISANGVGFITTTKSIPDMPVEIWLKAPDNSPIYLTGYIVWSKHIADKNLKWRTGVNIKKTNIIELGKIFAS